MAERTPDRVPRSDPAVNISPKMEKYRDHVDTFTVEELHRIRACLGFDLKKGNKSALVSATLGFLTFLEEKEHFQKWFASLPSYLSRAVEEASFNGYVDADRVAQMAGKPPLVEIRYSYDNRRQIDRDLRLGIFDLYNNYDQTLLFMKPFFRRVMASLLPVPSGYSINSCPTRELQGWSAEETLSESMPLLLRSIRQLLEYPDNHEKILRRGLNKSAIKAFRKSSAFPSFAVGAITGIDPIDLIARFLMIDPEQLATSSEMDVRDFVKGLVTDFFVVPPSGRITSHYFLVDSGFEYSVLCPHVTGGWGPRPTRSFLYPHPPARTIFYQILRLMAGSGEWYNMDDAAESIRMQALTFTIFRNDDSASACIVKGEELFLPEGTIRSKDWERGFAPDIFLSHTLITRPLLKGYAYLMASLGLLEIEEKDPEKRLKKNDALSPISPFDGLARARVTPFGAWCLGVSQEKPELRQVHYEAIADRELPLVTCRGQSLECRVYLEQIGDPVGEDRFRISEASVIRDCRTEDDIEHRIGEFHRLIARDPAGHWEELFSRIRNRSRLFDHQEPCMMIQLPEDRALRRLFLEEKKLASLVVRAEGGRIVVPQQNYNRLRKALEAYGVLRG